ncbi:membrane protein insertase YidC [Thalassobacillus hwangdonensis]|uniref:Membrane protein insertase YidC n=1 Tax=Thalassobacillus hwangdonensis TaxID=546108 RepID=A0ABW3KZ64_9BACI
MRRFFSLTGIGAFLLIVLAGCSGQPTENGGFFNDYFIHPFIVAIKVIAELFNENYGIAIILITLVIRIILLPFMMKNYKRSREMRGKMEAIKPEMDTIQKKLKEVKDPEEKRKIQQEMMALYQTHGVNPLNMGCLPLLLQMPVLMGFYYAIRGSEEIATHSFLWLNLGEPDILMAVIAGILYFVQYRVSLRDMPIAQQGQMKLLGLMSPIMIFIFSLNAPAALPLYWTVSGTFLILQMLLSRKLYPVNKDA